MSTYTGTSHADTLRGGTQADEISGLAGNDSLFGNAGNDLLRGGAGADTLDGGSGTDTASYADSSAAININLTTGRGSGGDAQGDLLKNIEVFIGTNFADSFTASSAVTLQGGKGDDRYVINSSGVRIVELVNAGNDEVATSLSSLSISAYANVERLTYLGARNFTGTGNDGDNIITGGSGNDILTGGKGGDQLIGGSGKDTASYADARAAIGINLRTGVHTGIAAGDTFSSIEAFLGSRYDDVFVGTSAGNSFNGGAGNDLIDYSASSSAVSINLTTGAVAGGDAQGDTLIGFERVIASRFNDMLVAAGTCTLQGGAGNDIYLLSRQDQRIIENVGGGNDEVRTTLNSLSIAAQANVEKLTFTGNGSFLGTGNSGDNTLTGGTGNDTLLGGAGADRFIGGSGTDTVSYADAGSAVSINLRSGSHTGIAAGDSFSGIEVILGSRYNDTFAGDASANRFNGGEGSDTISYSSSTAAVNINLLTGALSGGDAQGDILSSIENVVGSAFNDVFVCSGTTTIQGGGGNDIYILDRSGGKILEDAAAGVDEVRTALSTFSLAGFANVEKLTYTGSGNFLGTGNSSDNILTGGAGNDTLQGGNGADRLVGGAGSDTASYGDATAGVSINLKTGVHTGFAAGDSFSGIEIFLGSSYDDHFAGDAGANTFNGGNGSDTVDYSGSAAAVRVNLSSGVLAGGDAEGDTLTSIEKVVGSAFADTLASMGKHSLQGGAGDDLYLVGSTTVQVVEAASAGNDEVQTTLASLSIAGFANVEKLTYTGNGNFLGTGNASDNILTGGAGNDTLLGGNGADQLVGGAGTDTTSYGDATAAVGINLKTGVHTGFAAGDSFSSIEVFLGSNYDDRFVSDSSANSFNGGRGNDTVDYSDSAAAVSVNLSSGVIAGGDAEGDTLTNIEKVIGSGFADTLGSTGNHTLQGGAGDDLYLVGGSTVQVVEATGAGNDEVQTTLASLSIAGYSNVEKLTYTGSASFLGTGNAGDNVLTGGAGNDTLQGGDGADQLVGGDGSDTASYGDATSAVVINLKTGVHSGFAAGDSFSGIEIFLGSSYDDRFVGDGSANTFNGSGGSDTVDYSGSTSAISVDLSTGTGSGGEAEGDSLSSIERIVGSRFSDSLSANGAQTLQGNAGNDIYLVGSSEVRVVEEAGGGVDEVKTTLATFSIAACANVEKLTYTGTGDFLGTGNASDNIIHGGAGNDTLFGGDGADQFIGGSGTDTVSYGDASTAISINLRTGIHTGIAAGDTFNGIEIILGSALDDLFAGDAAANSFVGGDGSDSMDYSGSTAAIAIDLSSNTFSGGDAEGDTLSSIEILIGSRYADVLIGNGAGNILIGGLGADSLSGGSADTVCYRDSSAAVHVDLLAGSSAGGDAEGDVLSNIAKLIGSAHGDTLLGDAADNRLEGAAGNDLIRGGDGSDVLFGDVAAGSVVTASNSNQGDTLYGGNGDDSIVAASHDADSVIYGEAGLDVITINDGLAWGGLGSDILSVNGSGTARGDEGDDTLEGAGSGAHLYGNSGADTLNLFVAGNADGGDGSDSYNVNGRAGSIVISDSGSDGSDVLYLLDLDLGAIVSWRDGDDLRLGANAGQADAGIRLVGWYAGNQSIEQIVSADGQIYVV